MVPTAETHKELREVIVELQQLLNDVKSQQAKAANHECAVDSLYKLKAKAGEAIEFLKEQDSVIAPPATYQKKLHRLYQRL